MASMVAVSGVLRKENPHGWGPCGLLERYIEQEPNLNIPHLLGSSKEFQQCISFKDA
jgi:hypothetical protein